MGKFTKKVILEGAKGKKGIDLIVDTGSQISLIDKKIADEVGLTIIPNLSKKAGMKMADNKIEPVEVRAGSIKLGKCQSDVLIFVKENVDNLLGADVLQQMDALVDMKKHDVIIRKCRPYRVGGINKVWK